MRAIRSVRCECGIAFLLCLLAGCAEPQPLSESNSNAATSQNLTDSTSNPGNPDTSAGNAELPSIDGPDLTTRAPSSPSSPISYSNPPSPLSSGAGGASQTAPPAAVSSTAAPPAVNGTHIQLTGVALAQTLPEGTAMGFSLEYSVQGVLNPSARYEWVIEPPQGRAWRAPVQLTPRGDLTVFVPEWPPTSGTYTTYIEEVSPSGQRQLVSKHLKLTYQY